MLHKDQPDLFLLLSLLFVIIIHPVLDHGTLGRLVLSILIFFPVTVTAIRLSQKKHWLMPTAFIAVSSVLLGVVEQVSPNPFASGTKWIFLALFFAVAVAGLFSYLKNATTIIDAHLYTAVSIYLLIGMQWFCMYAALNAFSPGAIQRASSLGDRQTELLYFSLVTLSTIGYGDIVPVSGEARIMAALEGIFGVLYIAITIAVLVSSYKRPERPQ